MEQVPAGDVVAELERQHVLAIKPEGLEQARHRPAWSHSSFGWISYTIMTGVTHANQPCQRVTALTPAHGPASPTAETMSNHRLGVHLVSFSLPGGPAAIGPALAGI
jgi:hypothetical protein